MVQLESLHSHSLLLCNKNSNLENRSLEHSLLHLVSGSKLLNHYGTLTYIVIFFIITSSKSDRLLVEHFFRKGEKVDTHYVLKYPDGKLVALDGTSGCPYPTEDIRRTELWKSAEAADKFRGVMNREGFTIHRITVTITPVQGS